MSYIFDDRLHYTHAGVKIRAKKSRVHPKHEFVLYTNIKGNQFKIFVKLNIIETINININSYPK